MGAEAPGIGAEATTTEETRASAPSQPLTRLDLLLADFVADADEPVEDTWQITAPPRGRVWAGGTDTPVGTILGSPPGIATVQLLNPAVAPQCQHDWTNIDLGEDVLVVLAHVFPCRMLSSGHEARVSISPVMACEHHDRRDKRERRGTVCPPSAHATRLSECS